MTEPSLDTGGPDLTIVDVRATPVAVPRLSQFLPKTSHGETPISRYVIVELESADGLVGLGEVTCASGWNGEDAEGTVAVIERDLRGPLLGVSCESWAAILASVGQFVRRRPFLRAGLEMASLDLLGRSRDLPVVALLGGSYRTEIDTKFVLPARDTQQVKDMAREMLRLGVNAAKVKVGLDPDTDLDRIAGVREVIGPNFPLLIDANEGWRPDQGRWITRILEALGVQGIEQPFPRSSWDACALFRERTDACVIGDESIWSTADVHSAARTRAFDVVSIYPGKFGGMRASLQAAAAALASGLTVTYGSNLELGVGAAALAHTVAATPELSSLVPSDLIGPLYFESSLVTDSSFIGWSGARLPEGSGLGIELDRDAVAAHRIVHS